MRTNIKLVWRRLQMIKYCFPFKFLPVFTFNCDSFMIITICRDSCNTERSNSICLWDIYVPYSKRNLLNTNEAINWFTFAGPLILFLYIGACRLEHLHANFIEVQDIPWICRQTEEYDSFLGKHAVLYVLIYWSLSQSQLIHKCDIRILLTFGTSQLWWTCESSYWI